MTNVANGSPLSFTPDTSMNWVVRFGSTDLPVIGWAVVVGGMMGTWTADGTEVTTFETRVAPVCLDHGAALVYEECTLRWVESSEWHGVMTLRVKK